MHLSSHRCEARPQPGGLALPASAGLRQRAPGSGACLSSRSHRRHIVCRAHSWVAATAVEEAVEQQRLPEYDLLAGVAGSATNAELLKVQQATDDLKRAMLELQSYTGPVQPSWLSVS